jgi:hypothetical protein
MSFRTIVPDLVPEFAWLGWVTVVRPGSSGPQRARSQSPRLGPLRCRTSGGRRSIGAAGYDTQ